MNRFRQFLYDLQLAWSVDWRIVLALLVALGLILWAILPQVP